MTTCVSTFSHYCVQSLFKMKSLTLNKNVFRTGSEIVRGSADFHDYLVIPGISENLGRTLKAIGGGTSHTTWPTEMVHLSKFAEF